MRETTKTPPTPLKEFEFSAAQLLLGIFTETKPLLNEAQMTSQLELAQRNAAEVNRWKILWSMMPTSSYRAIGRNNLWPNVTRRTSPQTGPSTLSSVSSRPWEVCKGREEHEHRTKYCQILDNPTQSSSELRLWRRCLFPARQWPQAMRKSSAEWFKDNEVDDLKPEPTPHHSWQVVVVDRNLIGAVKSDKGLVGRRCFDFCCYSFAISSRIMA